MLQRFAFQRRAAKNISRQIYITVKILYFQCENVAIFINCDGVMGGGGKIVIIFLGEIAIPGPDGCPLETSAIAAMSGRKSSDNSPRLPWQRPGRKD